MRKSAERSLSRFGDPVTCSQRDDLVQEALVATWRYSSHKRSIRSLQGVAWTIAQRLRIRAIERQRRLPMETLDSLPIADEVREPKRFGLAGHSLSPGELLPLVQRGLAYRPGLNAELVADHYRGVSTLQLAETHGLSRNGVKRRLYRERTRLRRVVMEEITQLQSRPV